MPKCQNQNPQLLQVYDVLRAQAREREQRRGKGSSETEDGFEINGESTLLGGKSGGKLPEKAFKKFKSKLIFQNGNGVKHLKFKLQQPSSCKLNQIQPTLGPTKYCTRFSYMSV
jgi:hypothetical protein